MIPKSPPKGRMPAKGTMPEKARRAVLPLSGAARISWAPIPTIDEASPGITSMIGTPHAGAVRQERKLDRS